MPLLAPAVDTPASHAGARSARWTIAIALGALLVAIGAQVSLAVPGSPVPVTLQGFAVLLVAGVLGSLAGAAALVLYLVAGAAGLPVFAPVGLPGVARLLGPTGGYLLAFPVAAALTGALARRDNLARNLLASLAGMMAIHAGGIAQLSILTGGLALPVKATIPLLAADLVKVILAALLISRLRSRFLPS